MIRRYTEHDYPLLKSWWEAHGEFSPTPGMMPLETTFILEDDGSPAISACLYLMNTKEASKVENLVSSPGLDPVRRRELVKELFGYLEVFAKLQGYKVLVLFSHEDGLKKRYQELGFVPTQTNITTFAKILGG